MKKILILLSLSLVLWSCQKSETLKPITPGKTVVVTYSVLGSIVKEMLGPTYNVQTLIPNGLDVHEWEPSAQEIDALEKADLVVENGLGLEGGLSKILDQKRSKGGLIFTASSAIKVRTVGQGEGIPSDDPDQKPGAQDPHLWMDPQAIKAVVLALADYMKAKGLGDVTSEAAKTAAKLEGLDQSIKTQVSGLKESDRQLVTGHESLGYYAQAYGFKLLGAIIPSLTSQAEVSASELVDLKKIIQTSGVKVIFTELGTPTKVAQALAKEAGVKISEVHTHLLPEDGSYFTMMTNFTSAIVGSLK